MTYDELVAILNGMGVTPPDYCRASLYLDHLQAAKLFFDTTLATNLGANYEFVRRAVRSSSLLNELASTFDLYIGAAVADALFTSNQAGQNLTYRQYFDNNIFGPNYTTNRDNFRSTYTVSRDALRQLRDHFIGNIELACQRIIQDVVMLANFFSDMFPSKINISSLDKIRSTGSDFHKGGKQVLILTFNIVYSMPIGDDVIPMNSQLKVVYKPSDIEADCLIAGDSAAINKVRPGFMNASLFEIYNSALQTYKAANPGFTGEEVPVYKILPMVYMSNQPAAYPLQIRLTYGYIQFLDNDISGTALAFFGYYPFGMSDYMIFNGRDEAAITNKFYKIEGALSALACTFSIHDIHLENLRVKNYLPYFIDMEISLDEATSKIGNTSMIAGNIGGINGLFLEAQEFKWVVQNADTPNGAVVDKEYETKFYQNRLWKTVGRSNKQVVLVDTATLTLGFTQGMIILRAAQQNGDFTPWFARLANVLVRYIPYATAFFKNALINPFYFNSDNARGETTLAVYLMEQLTIQYKVYVRGADPKFLVLTPLQSLPDLLNLDVPIFYYRIGALEIVNSNGGQVTILPNIDIFNDTPPPPIVNKVVNTGRATFFANVPTAVLVDIGQVQRLGGPGYAPRELALRTSIQTAMAADQAPNPANIVPLN